MRMFDYFDASVRLQALTQQLRCVGPALANAEITEVKLVTSGATLLQTILKPWNSFESALSKTHHERKSCTMMDLFERPFSKLMLHDS